MLSNEGIWNIALQQSAYDMGCDPEDFLSNENVVGISQKHPLARKYLDLPLSCDQPFGIGDSGAGQGAFLLCRMVQYQIRPECHSKRFPPGLGGNHRKGYGCCG